MSATVSIWLKAAELIFDMSEYCLTADYTITKVFTQSAVCSIYYFLDDCTTTHRL